MKLFAIFFAGCTYNSPTDSRFIPTNATMREPGDNTGIPVVIDQSKGKGRFTEVTLTSPSTAQALACYGNTCAFQIFAFHPAI